MKQILKPMQKVRRMKMRQYEVPKMKIATFENEDIVTIPSTRNAKEATSNTLTQSLFTIGVDSSDE